MRLRTLLRQYAILSAALFCASLSAAPAGNERIEIDTQIFVKGHLITSPKIVVLPGEPAEMTLVSERPYQKTTMRVLAQPIESAPDQITMKFEVELANDGKLVRSSPHLVARSGTQATISIGDRDGSEAFRMNVTAVHKE